MTSPARFTSPLEVVQTIRNGPSCAILVEGEEQGSDAWLLRYILKDRLGPEVIFHGRDGRNNLVRELPDFIAFLPTEKVFAIVDRDFKSDEEVKQTYSSAYTGHLFYWQHYCIENYLLQPNLVANVINKTHLLNPAAAPKSLATPEAVEAFTLSWCQRLAPQVAGNWVIHDSMSLSDQHGLMIEGPKYFKGIAVRDEKWVLSQLIQSYAGWASQYPDLYSSQSLQERLDDKLARVKEKIATLPVAQQIVDGKRFLKPAFLSEVPPSLKAYFFSLLAEEASKNPPEDFLLLVEKSILPRWRKARAASAA